MAANIISIRPAMRAPTQLAQLTTWLCWRKAVDEGTGKVRKVPHYAGGGVRVGEQGSARDIAHLVSFDAAVSTSGFEGPGFAVLAANNITVADFDDCVDAHGRVHPDVEALVGGTYAEYSPSGRGVHAFYRGSFGANPKSHSTAAQWGFEVFSTAGFVTFTGQVLEITELTGSENTIAPISDALRREYTRRFGAARKPVAQAEPTLGLTQVRECLEAIEPPLGYNDWLRLMMAVHFETGGSDEGLELVDAWSARGTNYCGRELIEAKWEGFGRSGDVAVTGGSLLKAAREAGAEVGQVATAADFEVIPEPPRPAAVDPKPIDLAHLPAEPPEPRFVIPGWMPDNVVTLLGAHGGTGKSYLSLYIAICLAVGRHPFQPGAEIERTRVTLYSAEDDELVMQGRLMRYLRYLEVDPGALVGWLDLLDATGCDNVLFVDGERGAGRTTPRHKWLAERVQGFGSRVLIFDNASDAMGANENDRAKVRQFLNSMKRLASAVLLLSHVDAASSMADPLAAKGYSGSTAWHNSARSRWFMARQPESEDIILALPKVNYAKAGSRATIRWNEAHRVFVVADAREGPVRAADSRTVLLRMLEVAISAGVRVTPARNSAKSAWNVLKDMEGFPHGLTSASMAREVNAWILTGLAEEAPYIRDNRTSGTQLVLTEGGRRLAAAGAGEGIGDVV